MKDNINESEEFVYKVCKQSFLSLWSYVNPIGKKTKELCDILAVFDPHVVIISVKDIKPPKSDNTKLDWSRWHKRAIDDSAKQIYGAERWIETASHIIKKDGSTGLPFPTKKHRQIHRVAVAFGGDGKMPISFGDFGKGFVHVFDEESFNIILNSLDTIQDFVDYLTAKEERYRSDVKTLLDGTEVDLLAIYLHNGRQFPSGDLLINNNLWDQFSKKPEVIAKQREDENSYMWDKLIERFCIDTLHDRLEFGSSLVNTELSIRTMAKENRFNRRILGKSFLEFLKLAEQKKVRSRLSSSPSGVIYVFLALPKEEDRKYRLAELSGRCLVARSLNKDSTTVIGIATERPKPGQGYSLDLIYLYKETWTVEDQRKAEYAQREFGFFSAPQQTHCHEDEYPAVNKRGV